MNREEEWLLNEKYDGERTEDFFADCERLEQGEPLAYLIGHTPFLSTTIYLESRPLIPRPETEFWTEAAIEHMKKHEGTLRVLDLCAGSGCIGVAVLKALPSAQVDFAEIDTQHHDTIRKNIETNDIDPKRARIFGGSLFENIEATYNFIVTNPPYIDPVLDRAETSVKEHEPHRALYGGEGGMELILRILETAPRFLAPQGVLYIEHEPEQSEVILTHATQHGFHATSQPDQFGLIRYTVCARRDTESMAP